MIETIATIAAWLFCGFIGSGWLYAYDWYNWPILQVTSESSHARIHACYNKQPLPPFKRANNRGSKVFAMTMVTFGVAALIAGLFYSRHGWAPVWKQLPITYKDRYG